MLGVCILAATVMPIEAAVAEVGALRVGGRTRFVKRHHPRRACLSRGRDPLHRLGMRGFKRTVLQRNAGQAALIPEEGPVDLILLLGKGVDHPQMIVGVEGRDAVEHRLLLGRRL